MLHLIFNREQAKDRSILERPSPTFDAYFLSEWLNDPMFHKILKEVGDITVDENGLFHDPKFNTITTHRELATGIKHLCLVYFCKDLREKYYFNQAMMGENCMKILQEIAMEKEVYIYFAYYADFDDKIMNEIPIHNLITDEYYYSNRELFEKRWLYCSD